MNFTLSYVVINILQLGLDGNPLSGHIPWLQLPFMLLGEELLSFYILLISASLLINTKHSLLWSNLISALVFALLHVFTYWNGNIFLTLFHVLLLQGLSRLILNTVGLRTNAVWIPWTIHILFDIISLGLVYLA
ncbi:CPBP family glutamic-type intramembrane protease [Enterococcus sp. DIV0876]|uniref:CPBP family glutamic-type intramembrane protease n=1 Tax=Enterococcus sp. DIV0876 TaxID=2774633 RepID=UPI003D300BC6